MLDGGFLCCICKNFCLLYFFFRGVMIPKESNEVSTISSFESLLYSVRMIYVCSYYFRAELGKFFCFFGIHIPRNGTNNKFTVCVIQNCRSQAASLGTGRAKDGNDFLGCHKNVVMIIIENFLK